MTKLNENQKESSERQGKIVFGGKWDCALIEGRPIDPVYDVNTCHFLGPLQVSISTMTGSSISFQNVGLFSISFVVGIVTGLTLNPHEKALESEDCTALLFKFEAMLSSIGERVSTPIERERYLERMLRHEPTEPILYRIPGADVSLKTIPMDYKRLGFHLVVVDFSDERTRKRAYETREMLRKEKCPGERKRVLLSELFPN